MLLVKPAILASKFTDNPFFPLLVGSGWNADNKQNFVLRMREGGGGGRFHATKSSILAWQLLLYSIMMQKNHIFYCAPVFVVVTCSKNNSKYAMYLQY